MGDLTWNDPLMKKFGVPNLEILEAPIGDLIYYAKPVAQKRADASKLLSLLMAVGAVDPQVSNVPNVAWQQTQLNLSRGVLGSVVVLNILQLPTFPP